MSGAAAWEWVPVSYDRYLTHCRPDACIASVAFECQKAEKIPVDSWDHPMDVVFTEKATYRFHS